MTAVKAGAKTDKVTFEITWHGSGEDEPGAAVKL